MSEENDRYNLLFVIDNLGTGGAQTQMIRLAVGLTGRGHRVEVFCYATDEFLAKSLHEAGVHIHRFPKKSRFSTDVIFNIKRLIRQQSYDLVLSFLTTPNFYAIAAGRIGFHRVPVIISERFCDLPNSITRLERFSRWFYRFANWVVVNSIHQRKNFQNKYRWIKQRISTIYNGYDLDKLAPIDTEPNNHPLRLLTIASISPYKNGLCLVEALRILKEKYALTPVVSWVGRRFRQGEYALYVREMEKRIKAYGLDEQWFWLGQRTDVMDQMVLHDVLVHPSYGEGLPNVVCEAMCCARPVIVSDTLDHPRLVEHGKNGFLFDYRDPADLAEKIHTFAALSVEERHEMGMNGRRYAEGNLAEKRFLDEYEMLMSQLINHRA